jgi:hypothetical protein
MKSGEGSLERLKGGLKEAMIGFRQMGKIASNLGGRLNEIFSRSQNPRESVAPHSRKEEMKKVKERVTRKKDEFEEKVEPKLEGVHEPEERINKLTEIRRRIEREKSEKDKKE